MRSLPQTAGIDPDFGPLAALVPPVLPVVLTTVFAITLGLTGVPRSAIGQIEAYGLYGVANVVVLAGLVRWLDPEQRPQVFRFRRPSIRELGAAILAFVLGLVAYQVATRINAVLGTPMTGLEYSFTDPLAVGIVVVGAVVVAPVAEEVLYRGFLLGYLLDRGYSPVLAGALTVVAFAVIHLPNFGVGGAVFILLWGPIPTALRLWSDNLTGALLMHAANNLFAYVIVVGLLA